ncbi:3-oxoacyl-ACP synthase [Fibrobacter sp. UWB2]|uniref:ketoacyl-ACP synthase III n=1 Tax=Fibrobacter sp. UWB2 TaxID=1964358 RepID=UPI000B52552C|nr:ketoacyl-ACP synthase III [Fibrobacter sp. UWB2]OWV24475.1 3-oxoacyl-ACP synthase [Fibrobacter sp. UWB2]
MAFLSFPNVRIAGISAGVPQNIADNLHPTEDDAVSTEYSPEDFVKTTGVKERRVSYTLTTSDLCYAAAEKLIADLNWNKEDVGAIFFVSQSPDYILPATACILQDRLGLSKECFAEDISLGCSGWVYGLSSAASILGRGTIKKALVMCGEAKARFRGPRRRRNPLFGCCGTVTAVEFCEGHSEIMFHFGTDGSGFDAIITPEGGARNPVTTSSFDTEIIEGKETYRLQSRMKGMDVFSFGITAAPKSVKSLAAHYNFDYLQADWFVFHQANTKMNNMIAKKLKLPMEKVPSSMYKFGNTNGASIPMTIVAELKNKAENKPAKFLCCGFGVGLSWGTTYFETENLVISDLVEVSDEEVDKVHVV